MSTNIPSVPVAHGRTAQKLELEVTIQRSPEEVYAFWRDFRNLPKFMNSVESVECSGDGKTSHWHVNGPLGVDLSWDAVIINDHPGRLIAWETLGKTDLPSAGTVRFEPMAEAGWTHVKMVVDYYPPGGAIAVAVAALLQSDPERILTEDLKRLKVYLENQPSSS
jgi:uncharacterized membrane protein